MLFSFRFMFVTDEILGASNVQFSLKVDHTQSKVK